MRRLHRFPSLAVAGLVFALAAAGLTAIHHSPRSALPATVAIRDAEQGIRSIPQLHGLRFDRVDSAAVDARLVRVTFWSGDRIAAEVAVGGDGSIQQGTAYTRLHVPYGNWLAYEPAVLLGLSILFVLMTAVTPLRRARNVDVLAALSLLAPVLLLQHRYLDASVLAALPGLGWLGARCAVMGLGGGSPAAEGRPLFDALVHSDSRGRLRILRWLLGAVAAVTVMVAVTSPDAVDVVYALMEGATRLLHGVLPYGHMPGDVIHGDTYPILSYAAYVPLAALTPVSTTWATVDLALGATAVTALLAAALLLRYGARARRDPQSREAGLRAALAWLSFPPLLITVSTGTSDVLLALMLLVAVLLWRRSALATGALAAAGWFKLAPFALLPIWAAPLRGRALVRAGVALAAVSAAMLGLLVLVGGSGAPAAMLRAVAYQFSRGSPQSLWAALGITALQPVGQALALALIAGTAVRLRTAAELAEDRARVAASAAAILIALQLSADYWAFLYLAWVVPLLVLSVLAPVRQPATAPVLATRPTGPLSWRRRSQPALAR